MSDRSLIPETEIERINRRLDEGDARMERIEKDMRENTALTRQIALNTAGVVSLTEDMQKGAAFLCRLARGLEFISKRVIEPLWKPALIIFAVVYYVMHDHKLPEWIVHLLRMAA